MNKRLVTYVLGFVLIIEGIAMQLPSLTALYYSEPDGFYFLFIGTALIVLGSAVVLILKNRKSNTMKLRDGFAATSLGWILLSVCGALPFYLSGSIPNFIDAFFETVSGFTTTGASILSDVESLSRCMLMWRSFIIWIGGMGVIVFLLALIPNIAGSQSIALMKAESPGPVVGKFSPKLRTTAMTLYGIYIVLTLIQIILLLCGGMSVFDSLNTAFSTAGTGGFSVKNTSIAAYDSIYLQSVVTVFMLLFSLNFSFYVLLIYRKFKSAFLIEEIRWYAIIVVVSSVLIAVNISGQYDSPLRAVHDSLFQVSSIISSTGFSNTDFDQWPVFSKSLILILMCIGACAGSTGGGFKVSRVIMLFKQLKKEFALILHPKNIKSVKMDEKSIKHETMRSVTAFLAVYLIIIVVSFLIISLDKGDITTNIASVFTTINNTGPGLSMTGPTQNFGWMSSLSKLTLSFNMLAGRLEFFPLLILFYPKTWVKNR